MNEKEGYFKSYCNSKGTALSFYVERLLKTNNDKEKESLLAIICEYIADVDATSKKLGINNHQVNRFDNNVMLLRSFNNDFINEYLHNINYDYVYNFEYLNIMHKLRKNIILSHDDLEFIEFLLSNNFINNDDMELITDYFIKAVITRENIETIVSMNGIKNVLKLFTKLYTMPFISGVACHTSNKNDNEYLDKRIYISKDELYNFYYNGDTSILLSIFSQIYKVLANRNSKDNLDDKKIMELKDYVLCQTLDSYEESNHDVISYNINSKKYAIEEYAKLIAKYELKFKNSVDDPFAKEQEELDRMITSMRTYDQKNIDVDTLFKKLIENYFEIANNYPELVPKLNLLMDNDIVRRYKFVI